MKCTGAACECGQFGKPNGGGCCAEYSIDMFLKVGKMRKEVYNRLKKQTRTKNPCPKFQPLPPDGSIAPWHSEEPLVTGVVISVASIGQAFPPNDTVMLTDEQAKITELK